MTTHRPVPRLGADARWAVSGAMTVEKTDGASETSLAIAAREGMWAARVFCKDADWHHLMDWCPPCGYEGEGVIPAMPEPACSVLTAGPVDREEWRP